MPFIYEIRGEVDRGDTKNKCVEQADEGWRRKGRETGRESGKVESMEGRMEGVKLRRGEEIEREMRNGKERKKKKDRIFRHDKKSVSIDIRFSFADSVVFY